MSAGETYTVANNFLQVTACDGQSVIFSWLLVKSFIISGSAFFGVAILLMVRDFLPKRKK